MPHKRFFLISLIFYYFFEARLLTIERLKK